VDIIRKAALPILITTTAAKVTTAGCSSEHTEAVGSPENLATRVISVQVQGAGVWARSNKEVKNKGKKHR